MSAGNVFSLAGSADGSDNGTCQPTPLVEALLRQYLHLRAVWLRPGDYPSQTAKL